MADNEKSRSSAICRHPHRSAALLAALTTVYINIRNDLKAMPRAAAIVADAKPVEAKANNPRCRNSFVCSCSGSPCSRMARSATRTAFRHRGDGQPLFAFEQNR